MTDAELRDKWDKGVKELLLAPTFDRALESEILAVDRELRARGIFPALPRVPVVPPAAPMNEDK